ncbi:MAG: Flp family type IVb pilin [Proteobacteria bacterium]|nr:Flp family type IVb pilin [Pseudomonadota bacterium]
MKHLFYRDKSGATSIEYGLIAALVAVAAIGAIGSVGGNLSNTYWMLASSLGSGEYGEYGGGPSPEEILAFYGQYGGGDAVDRAEMQTGLDNECPPEGDCPTVEELFNAYDSNTSDDIDWDEWQVFAYDMEGP